jgi:hypothetical protein
MTTDNQLLNVLTREGVLLNASVRFWRGCKKLRAEDIGLDPDNVSDRSDRRPSPDRVRAAVQVDGGGDDGAAPLPKRSRTREGSGRLRPDSSGSRLRG